MTHMRGIQRASPLAGMALFLVVLAAGCTTSPSAPAESDKGVWAGVFSTPTAIAVAKMEPVAGSRVEGQVKIFQYDAIVVVRANFIGLEPNREYGLHIHEKGDCSGAGASAAGGHFNPGGAPHGRPGRGPHHAGDLPNVQALGEGAVSYAYETRALSVTEGPASVVGRSVVITRNPDDYQTQPDGKSGPPLACGLIRRN
jgi:Cu-Zn family superoxide dismutase